VKIHIVTGFYTVTWHESATVVSVLRTEAFYSS